MKKRISLLPFIFLLLGRYVLAQTAADKIAQTERLFNEIKKYDALKKEKGQTNYIPADTQKASLIWEWYLLSDIHKNEVEIKQYVAELKSISTKLNYKKGIANALSAEAIIIGGEGEIDTAMALHKKALAIRQQINDHWGIRRSLYSIGNCYDWQNQYKESAKYYLASLKLCEQYNDSLLLASNLLCLGIMHGNLANNKLAAYYLNKAIAMFTTLNDSYSLCTALLFQVNYLSELKQFTEAKQLLIRAEKPLADLNDDRLWNYYYSSTATFYELQEKYDKAATYYKMSLKLGLKLNDESQQVYDYLYVGESLFKATNSQGILLGYNKKQKLSEAKKYLQTALNLSIKNNYPQVTFSSYKLLSTIAEQEGNYALAMNYYKQYVIIKDTVVGAETTQNIDNLKIQYETEKKEQQIALLNKDKALQQTEIQKQKTTRNAFMGGTALVLLLAGVTYNRYRVKQKANKQIEQTLLHLKNTQEQIIQQGKLAALGKMTNEVATEINVPVGTLKNLLDDSRQLFATIKHNGATNTNQMQELKTKLNNIQQQGLAADDVVKRVLKEIRNANA